MSKITMSTDWHFGKSNGRFDKIILDGIKQQCAHAKQHGITTMLNLGDTLDVKQTISMNTMNILAEAFELINNTFDAVYMLVGNHDMSRKTYDSTGHNLHIFKGYSNIKVIDSPTICELFGKGFYLLPYLPAEYMKDHQFPRTNYMCGHIEVKGFMLNQFVKSEEGIDANSIIHHFDHVFLGHFHKKQTRGKISYIGNMCRFFYGEDADERGWTVLNVDNGTREFVEYLHPRMYKFKVSSLLEVDDLDMIFTPGDNLKLVIDTNIKYSELEELKSRLMLTYKINDLILDDQYFAWDDLDSIIPDEEEETSTQIKTKENQTYLEYVVSEMIKLNKVDDTEIEERESIKFLRELSKQYQE